MKPYPMTIDGAVFEVKRHPAYNRTDYGLTLVSGEWPSSESILEALGAIPQCGGGKVSRTGAKTASVLVWGCD